MINKEEILLSKRILITRLIESTDYRISISKKRKKKETRNNSYRISPLKEREMVLVEAEGR